MEHIVIIFLLCFVCGVVQGAIGFGSVIIMMAVMPLFLPVGTCVILAQLSGTVLSFWMLWNLRRRMDWKKACVPTMFAVVFGSVPGKRIYGKLDIKTFRLMIHIFIGILGVYIFLSN